MNEQVQNANKRIKQKAKDMQQSFEKPAEEVVRLLQEGIEAERRYRMIDLLSMIALRTGLEFDEVCRQTIEMGASREVSAMIQEILDNRPVLKEDLTGLDKFEITIQGHKKD